MSSQLFSPYRLRGLELPNRVVVSPMAQYSATAAGHATAWHHMHYGNLAVSGAGLLIFEAIAVEAAGRVSARCLGLWTDAQAESLRPVLEFCRQHGGAKLGVQLAHSGRKGSVQRPWEGQNSIGPDEEGWQVVSSCAEAYPGRATPHALSLAEMEALKAGYVAAARRADAIGFDLIELHAAHGYLLNCFLTPLANRRNDAYGGDLAGRMRYPLEVFAAIRAAWPAHKPLGVRISATDWKEGGWTGADSVAFAQALKAAGCDYVGASSGGVAADQQIVLGPGYQVPYAAQVQREAGMPAMAVGMINEPEHAEAIVRNGEAELVALGRGMTWNPRWAWHAADALGAKAAFPPQYARSHSSMRYGDPAKPR